MSPATPLFEENAGATMSACVRTFQQRGDEYGDTWRHSQHLTLRAVYKELVRLGFDFLCEIPREVCDCLAAAVLVDVKYQRIEGRFKLDSLIDGINYAAYLAEAMRKVAESRLPKCALCNGSGVFEKTTDGGLIDEPCPSCRPRAAAPSLHDNNLPAVPDRRRSV